MTDETYFSLLCLDELETMVRCVSVRPAKSSRGLHLG